MYRKEFVNLLVRSVKWQRGSEMSPFLALNEYGFMKYARARERRVSLSRRHLLSSEERNASERTPPDPLPSPARPRPAPISPAGISARCASGSKLGHTALTARMIIRATIAAHAHSELLTRSRPRTRRITYDYRRLEVH